MDFEIGDEVEIQVAKDNRDWGYNPAPDGTKGIITKFAEIAYGRTHSFGKKPGIYENRCWPCVKLETGEEICISYCHIKHTQVINREIKSGYEGGNFVRDLPDLPFWEEDLVNVIWGEEFVENVRIIKIDYDRINEKCVDGVTPFPIYTFALNGGGKSFVREEKITLVERGNVWKYYHNEPLSFSSLEEEANFFSSIGHKKELRNPKNGLYSWTLEEVLQGIKSGAVHGFTIGGMFSSDRINAYKFDDENLGKRVAEETLKGFNVE